MEIPEKLKQKIEEQIQGIKTKEIIENSQKISERYRNNEGKGKKMLTKLEEALSYSISRMPSTYCAVYSVVEHVLEIYNRKLKSCLDIGAGTGAAIWAINDLIDIKHNICLEREKAMINIGKSLMKNTNLMNTEWIEFDILNNEINLKADIVITSYMINELPENKQEDIVKKLWDATEQILLILEPGTPTGFKNIIKSRDLLLKQGANIMAPCTHQEKCRLNDDWCSFYVRVSRSGIQRLSKKGELNYEDEKFSYIAFSKSSIESIPQTRILRHPQINSGYVKLRLCTPYGIEEKTISKKDRETYKKAKKLDAGDILK